MRRVIQPDLIFFLDASAEILQQRKAEVSFIESERQRVRYLELARLWGTARVFDASLSLDVITFHTQSAIFACIIERNRSGFSK
jgi:thymidylate kinase